MFEKLFVEDTNALQRNRVQLVGGLIPKPGLDLVYSLHPKNVEGVEPYNFYLTLGIGGVDKTVDETEIDFENPVPLRIFDEAQIPVHYVLYGAESNLMRRTPGHAAVSFEEAVEMTFFAMIAKQARLEIEWSQGGVKFALNIDGTYTIRARATHEELSQWFTFPEPKVVKLVD